MSRLPNGFSTAYGGDGTTTLSSILPIGLSTAVGVGSVLPDPLHYYEEAIVKNSRPRRRYDFARGRTCARRAMAQLGYENALVLSDHERVPMWPTGLVGSISHSDDYCCAVVGNNDKWTAIGVDVELLRVLEPAVDRAIVTEEEQSRMLRLQGQVPWSCVIFSIKEAVYKAWYPQTRIWLDYQDVRVCLRPDQSTFEALIIPKPRSIVPARFQRLTGRFCFDAGHVLTTVAIAA